MCTSIISPRRLLTLALLGLCLYALGCGPVETVPPGTTETKRPESWTAATHSKEGKADYDTIFSLKKVHRIDLTISAENWQKMMDHMTKVAGEFGAGQGQGRPGQPGGGGGRPPRIDPATAIKACEAKSANDACEVSAQGQTTKGTCNKDPRGGGDALHCMPAGGRPGGGGPGGGGPGGGGPGNLIPEEPIYVPCTLKYEGKTWNNVGYRWKGNSSLNSAWRGGNYKIPFRLSMDKYEDQDKNTEDQRFYGFKKLTFGSGFSDNSLMREVMASELFRAAGVPIARVAYYRVYIDYGKGSKYFGLYTMVEDPDGPMLKNQFKSNDGNLYKPDGTGAELNQFVEKALIKKTNEDKPDWSDVKSLIETLQADRSDAAAWRSRLEKQFNVDGFLRWIAMANLMVHWDTYGAMTHNYYLYADPGDNNRIHWISWDHNETMLNKGRGTELGLPNVDPKQWPLLGHLRDDPVYRKRYNQYVAEFAKGHFATDKVVARLKELHAMIAPYVVGENGEQSGYTQLANQDAFKSAVDDLKKHVESRQSAAAAYLKTQDQPAP